MGIITTETVTGKYPEQGNKFTNDPPLKTKKKRKKKK